MTFQVLGLDPGTRNAGLAVVQRERRGWSLIYSPVLNSFDDLLQALAHVWLAFDVQCASMEDVSWSFLKHKRAAASGSVGMSLSIGAVQMLAAMKRISCQKVATSTFRKMIAGSGKATSENVRTALERQWIASGWPKGAVSTHRSDAIAIAISGAMKAGIKRNETQTISAVGKRGEA